MFRATIFSRIELRLALGLLTFALMSEAGQQAVLGWGNRVSKPKIDLPPAGMQFNSMSTFEYTDANKKLTVLQIIYDTETLKFVDAKLLRPGE
jgi:hypothetical protein